MPPSISTSNNSSHIYVEVVLGVPLRRSFDYLPHQEGIDLKPGMRVLVPFGRREQLAIIIAINNKTECPINRLKKITRVLDSEPLWTASTFDFFHKVSRYYHHPLGETLMTALPVALRHKKDVLPGGEKIWSLSEKGRTLDGTSFGRAKAQLAIWSALKSQSMSLSDLKIIASSASSVLKRMQELDLISNRTVIFEPENPTATSGPKLNSEQQQAVDSIFFDKHQTSLLYGVTGSGKTEVYIHLMQKVLDQGKQVLVLVPEISLTPQLLDRLSRRLGIAVASLHSELADKQRHTIWYRARKGTARVIVGTRSAIFTPMPQLGLIIVDEEHDDSFKQQEGLRYNGRDVAIWRAQVENIAIVLGSATPSLSLLHNIEHKDYQLLRLKNRAGQAKPPELKLIDLRNTAITEGLSVIAWKELKATLEAGNQAMVFVNRRGYAPVLICEHCGWQAPCPNCDSLATFHKKQNTLKCHHCGWVDRKPHKCPDCGSQHLEVLGHGTQRLESALEDQLNFPIIRVDRDVMNKRDQHEKLMKRMQLGQPCVLVGTQMLAKGHDFSDLTLVVIVNLDQGLFSLDFRAPERLAQLVEQVSGRAGRAKKSGKVLIQTYIPEDPFFQTLIHSGYETLSHELLKTRKLTELPPYTYMALIRASSKNKAAALRFLDQIVSQIQIDTKQLLIEGPVESSIARRAGKYRAYVQISSIKRQFLHNFLSTAEHVAESLSYSGQWSIDIDPVESG